MLGLLTGNKYYNHPEGKAPFEKIYATSKFGLASGLAIGLYDTMNRSQVTRPAATFNCFAYWVIPLTAMCGSFSAGVYIATNLRGKDDKVNYAIGGLSSGAILYAWQRNVLACGVLTAVITLMAVLKKTSIEEGWDFFPMNPKRLRPISAFEQLDLSSFPEVRPWKQ